MMGQMDKIENDFLGQLLKVYGDPDERNRMTINDLIDDCKNFYVAGQETTTSALCWTILLLAIHTEWQEKVRLEVLELLGHQFPTAEGISKLKIMSMVVNESLRLYAPLGGTFREVPKGTRLGSVTVPSTMEIQVSPPALHQDPEIWGDDGHLFKPERFAERVAKATNNITAGFIPFGLGPRHCVGMNFALNEIKIVLSMILQRYKFILSPSYVHSPVAHLGLIPEHGLQVMLQAA